MRALFVTKFVPEPATSGGRLRSSAVLRELEKHADVTVACFEDGSGDAEALRARGLQVHTVPWPVPRADQVAGLWPHASITTARFASRELRRLLAGLSPASRPWDLVQVEYLQMGPYGLPVPARRRVLDLHNVESDLTRGLARTTPGAKGRALALEATALARMERRLAPRYDAAAVVSERDGDMLPGRWRQVAVCPNGLQLPAAPSSPPADSRTVTFAATLGWQPNEDAAVWLARKVWPVVRQSVPDAQLVLVGRDPGSAVRALAGSGVEVAGTVPDVAPYIERAALTVAPLLAGGGSRLKILESLGWARGVVATTIGASGLEGLGGAGIVLADEPAHFAAEVVRLLQDPQEATRLGRRGREAVHAYAWDTVLAPFAQLWAPTAAAGDQRAGA